MRPVIRDAGCVLLTGINGFVGKHTARVLLEAGHRVVGMGRSETCSIRHPNLLYKVCDLNDMGDLRELLRSEPFDRIIHLAGDNDVQRSFDTPLAVVKTNLGGTLNLLEAVRTLRPPWLRAFLAIGTGHEYGSRNRLLTEKDPPEPASPYAWSKYAMTSAVRMYGRVYGIPAIAARTFNLVGPGGGQGVCAQLARQTAMIEKGLLPPMLSLGKQEVLRDFLDVRDAAAAYALLVSFPPEAPGSLYNVCSGAAHSVGEIVELLQGYATVPFELMVEERLFRRNEPLIFAGSNWKLRKKTGWQPRISFEKSVRDTLDYFRSHVNP